MNIRDKITVITSWLDDVPNRSKEARKFMDYLADENSKLSIELQYKVENLPISDVSVSLPFGTKWQMKTVNTKRVNGTKDCRWAINTGTAYREGFKTPDEALKWAKRISGYEH